MTEEEWLTGADPTPMFVFLHGKASDRKLRLFIVGCVRTNSSLDDLIHIGSALDTSEAFAEGQVAQSELRREFQEWMSFWENIEQRMRYWGQYFSNERLRLWALTLAATLSPELLAKLDQRPHWVQGRVLILETQPHLLSDIFGNPFRPVVADPGWLTPTAVSIASAIYQDRAFDRLPILADALEEAGCTNADVLLHCRQPGEHVRGCWVVDLALGKE